MCFNVLFPSHLENRHSYLLAQLLMFPCPSRTGYCSTTIYNIQAILLIGIRRKNQWGGDGERQSDLQNMLGMG